MKDILKYCCVRVSIISNGKRVNCGTGVVVVNGDSFFVLTAEHCLNGDNGQFEGGPLDDVHIEFQQDYAAPFERVRVIKIVSFDRDADWAVLQVEKPSGIEKVPKIYPARNGLVDEEVVFWGYQRANIESHRLFKGKLIDNAKNQFKITLSGSTFQQNGEDGSFNAKGLSGSGVFIIRSSKVYLVGIVKNVIGEGALNDDIDCCHTQSVSHLLSDSNCIDLGSIDELSKWEEAAEKYHDNIELETWKAANDIYFQHLHRKCTVLYEDPDIIKKVITQRLRAYLIEEYKFGEMRVANNQFVIDFESTANAFEETVKYDYTRVVSNSSEAKDLLIRLEDAFKNHISMLVRDKSNKRQLELSKHKITSWLLNCSFNFK